MREGSTDRETVEPLAPERIWAAPSPHGGWAEAHAGDWPSPANPHDTKFVRHDLYDAAVARAEVAEMAVGARDALLAGCREDRASAEAEVERLLPWAQLGVAVMEGWPEIGDVDEFMVQEMAVKTGVLREIPGGYDPEQHYDSVGVDPEPGDPWFERIAIPRAALGEGCE